jgi:hypothetical protein
MIRSRFAVLLVSLFLASAGFAQSNDIAVSFGGTFFAWAYRPAVLRGYSGLSQSPVIICTTYLLVAG